MPIPRQVTGETVKIPYLPSRGSKRGLFKADVSSWADDEAGQEEGEGRGTGEEKDEDDMKGRLDKEVKSLVAIVATYEVPVTLRKRERHCPQCTATFFCILGTWVESVVPGKISEPS